ncbi:MAG: hypothetical protein NC336_09025 [Clostridium sp.]|nr:hypothetical protein [Clostridium sp.]
MKKIIMVLVVVVASLLAGQAISAQTPTKNDSITNAVRLNSLQRKKESLQKEIKVQDAKRNQQIQGVSAETMELMNDKQDSLCLALRSELTDVVLEIKELSAAVTSPQLIDQYNNLIHRSDSVQTTSVQLAAPAGSGPSKPKK